MKKVFSGFITAVVLAVLILAMYLIGISVNQLLGRGADHSGLYFFTLGFLACVSMLFLIFISYLIVGIIINLKIFKEK